MAKNTLPPVDQFDVVKFFSGMEEALLSQPPSEKNANILVHIEILREARQCGDIDLAIAAALNVGFAFVHELSGLAEKGLASEDGARRGGEARRGSTEQRDVELATEFRTRRASARCSDTALKTEIGKAHGLSRTQAIEAINRGLKKLSG